MKPSHLLGRVLLWVIAIYHIATGALLILSGDLSIRFADAFYGWKIKGSSELGILGELLGCYAIAFGLMMVVAARDPVAHRSLITIGVVLIALRLFQRVYFSSKILDVFQVSSERHWAAFVFLILLAGGLALFRYQIHLQARSTAAVGP